MRLDRFHYDPMTIAQFFEDGLTRLGAVCERAWHDRIQLIAEGRAARLWNPEGLLVDKELLFPPPDSASPRDADIQVFPGCPLTFRLAEALQPAPLSIERVVLRPFEGSYQAPAVDLAERAFRAQMPGSGSWRLDTPFQLDWHHSLVALVRSELQAIEQHWSVHRLAITLPGGDPDDHLAASFDLAEVEPRPNVPVAWPEPALQDWNTRLRAALVRELDRELGGLRARQERHLARELDRIEDYFDGYERELTERQRRAHSETARVKTADRLAAARAERARRREDQIQRHEIRLIPHWDALLLVAEPAWRARVVTSLAHRPATLDVPFLPRLRRWVLPGSDSG
jgi:hypothetical protein